MKWQFPSPCRCGEAQQAPAPSRWGEEAITPRLVIPLQQRKWSLLLIPVVWIMTLMAWGVALWRVDSKDDSSSVIYISFSMDPQWPVGVGDAQQRYSALRDSEPWRGMNEWKGSWTWPSVGCIKKYCVNQSQVKIINSHLCHGKDMLQF